MLPMIVSPGLLAVSKYPKSEKNELSIRTLAT